MIDEVVEPMYGVYEKSYERTVEFRELVFINPEGKDIQLSKSLTWLLRHGAVSEGVKIDENGYIKVNDILNHRLFTNRCTINDIRRIVALSRQKFTLKSNFLNGYLEIRANRGHTFKKPLMLTGPGTIDITNRKPGFFDTNTINEKQRQHLRQFDAQILTRQQQHTPVRHSLKYSQHIQTRLVVTPKIELAETPENIRRGKLMDYSELARVLNWILRYGSARERIQISPEGFVKVNDILDNRFFRGRCSFEDIEVVALNEPFNYELIENTTANVWIIRALEEHKIKKKFPDWTYITHPAYLPFRYIIHGVNGSGWIKIIKKGIKCPPKSYIYFSPYEAEDSQATLGVSKYDDIFIYVDADAAMQDGIEFYKTAENAITTKGKKGYISVEYFLKVVDAKTGVGHCNKVDLKKIFSRFGKVEEISEISKDKPYCFIRFDKKECVQKALKARLFFAGKRLFVREVRAQNQSDKTKEDKSSVTSEEETSSQELKNKNTVGDDSLPVFVPDPQDFLGDCSSVFDWQVKSIISQIIWEVNDDTLDLVCKDVESIFNPLLPYVRAVVFGSCLTGLALKNSDVDIFMECPGRQPGEDFVKREAKVIYRSKLVEDPFRIPTARVPIVRFTHKSTNIRCDVAFKNNLGVCNSNLIKFYLNLDERVKPLFLIIKYWARVYRLSGIKCFSNYALVIMAIFYLQQLDPPVLPTVLELHKAAQVKQYVDGWDASFSDDPLLWQPSKNNSTLKELLRGFFKFYSQFDYNNVICPLLGKPFPVSDFDKPDELPESMNMYKENLKLSDKNEFKKDLSIRIQDPFELSYNLGRGLYDKIIERFVNVCTQCWNIFNGIEEDKILETILTVDETSPLSNREFNSFVIRCDSLGPGHQSTSSAENTEDVNNWFVLVKKSIIGIFKEILKLELQFNDAEKVQIEKNETCVDYLKNQNATDKLQFICKGKSRVWIQRKKHLKMAKFFLNMDYFEQEVFASDEIFKTDKADLPLIFKTVISPVQTFEGVPEVKLSLVDYGPVKCNMFKQFITFISINFSEFVENAVFHFSRNIENTDNVTIKKYTSVTVKKVPQTEGKDETKTEKLPLTEDEILETSRKIEEYVKIKNTNGKFNSLNIKQINENENNNEHTLREEEMLETNQQISENVIMQVDTLPEEMLDTNQQISENVTMQVNTLPEERKISDNVIKQEDTLPEEMLQTNEQISKNVIMQVHTLPEEMLDTNQQISENVINQDDTLPEEMLQTNQQIIRNVIKQEDTLQEEMLDTNQQICENVNNKERFTVKEEQNILKSVKLLQIEKHTDTSQLTSEISYGELMKGNLGQKRTDTLFHSSNNISCPIKKKKKRKNKHKNNAPQNSFESSQQNNGCSEMDKVFNVERSEGEFLNALEPNQTANRMDIEEKVLVNQKLLLQALSPKHDLESTPFFKTNINDDNISSKHANESTNKLHNVPNQTQIIKYNVSVEEYCRNADSTDPYVAALKKIQTDLANNK